MMNMAAKVSFELTKEDKVTMQLHGSHVVIKSGLLTIMERLAELEERNILDLLSELTEVAKMKEEMPPELRAIFDVVFGGEK